MHGKIVSDVRWKIFRYQRHFRSILDRWTPNQRRYLAVDETFSLSHLSSRSRAANETLIRSLSRSAELGERELICRILGRYKFFVDGRDKGLSSHLLIDGFWEMWVTEAIARLVRPGMVVADVGANLGYYSVLMGDLVGPTGWVHAFEPNPPTALLLRQNVAMNTAHRRTTVHEIALTDFDGSAILYAPPFEPKNASITGTENKAGTVSVAARRLDSIEGIDRLDFLKIDAEGAEQAIWRGMGRYLEDDRAPTILLEYAGDRLSDAGGFIDEIIGRGFSMSLIRPDGRTIPIQQSQPDGPAGSIGELCEAQPNAAERAEQNIGHRGEPQTQLVGAHRR